MALQNSTSTRNELMFRQKVHRLSSLVCNGPETVRLLYVTLPQSTNSYMSILLIKPGCFTKCTIFVSVQHIPWFHNFYWIYITFFQHRRFTVILRVIPGLKNMSDFPENITIYPEFCLYMYITFQHFWTDVVPVSLIISMLYFFLNVNSPLLSFFYCCI